MSGEEKKAPEKAPKAAPAAAPSGAAVVLSASCPNGHVVEVRGGAAHQAAAELVAQLVSAGVLDVNRCATCGTRVRLEAK